MDKNKIVARIQAAEKYIYALSKFHHFEWAELYDLYLSKELTLEERFCLIHPVHLEELGLQNKIQGNRAFNEEPGVSTMLCQSNQIWGYSCCAVKDQNRLVADHLFPYSLGGPTIASNKLYLCKFHNQVKSNDIHFFPWERGEPDWLSIQIARVRNEILR